MTASLARKAAPEAQSELLRVVEKLCAEGRAKRLAGELMPAWRPGEFHGREDYDRWKTGEEWTR